MRALAVLALLAAGCPGASYHTCPGGDWLCPNGMSCAQPPVYCGTMQQVMECDGASDFATCTHHDEASGSDVTGSCLGNVCTPCNVDRAGCSFGGWYAMTPVALDTVTVLGTKLGAAFIGGTPPAGKPPFLAYDGRGWAASPGFPAIAGDVGIAAIAGTDGSVFVLDQSNDVFHFDGTAWQDVTPSPKPLALKALCSLGANQVIAVGALSTVLHYDGSAWTTVPPSGSKTYKAVWASSASDIFVAGDAGLAEHFDGATWTTITVDSMYATSNLHALWGSSSNDVYVVGDRTSALFPTVLHYTSAATGFAPAVSVGAAVNMFSIWGTATDDVFAVGDGGQILRYTGSWTPMVTPTSSAVLSAVGGSSATDVFAAGVGGTLWHYAGP
jgi:hypothetical protein